MTVGIVLAGGRGSRMAPWTPGRGKFQVPYFDSTVLHEAFGFLGRCGARRYVVLVAAELAATTAAACADTGLPADVTVARSDSWRLVWAQIAAASAGERVVLVNCDLILDPGWASVVEHHESAGTAISVAAAPPWSRGRGKVVRRTLDRAGVLRRAGSAGGTLCSRALIGLSVIEPSTWDLLEGLDYSCSDPFTDRLLDRTIDSGGVSFTDWDVPAYDVGTWPGLLAAHLEAADPSPRWRRAGSSWIHEEARVDSEASLQQCVLWPGAHVEGPGTSQDLMLMSGVQVASGLRRTAVWSEAADAVHRATW
jgi:NDP-sugar pyrophosphorylase family protein